MQHERRRPGSVVALAGALFFQALSGLAGGYGLTFDRTGESLGLPLEWLDRSPFQDYLIPGTILLTVLGIGPLIAVYGVWTRKRWSWPASLLIGVALLVWIGVEIAVIGYHPQPPLQLVYGSLGALIVALGLAPSVRAHLSDAVRPRPNERR